MSFTSLLATVVASYQMMPRSGEAAPIKGDSETSEATKESSESEVQEPVHGDSETPEDICNGVKGLCQYQAHEVFWYGANGIKDLRAPTQTKSVTELLEHGARAFKVEIYPSTSRDERKGLGRIHIQEGGWLLGMGKSSHLDFLREVAAFLNEHPNEVVSISYVNHVRDWRLIYHDFKDAGFADKLFDPANPENWTLGKQVQEDKRLIIFFENRFKEPRGRGAKSDAAELDKMRPDLYQGSWKRGLVRDSSYGLQVRKKTIGWCKAPWGSQEALYAQLNYWDTTFPRKKASQRLLQAEPLEDSLFGLMATCHDEDNLKRPLYNMVFTNHSHLGPGAALVQGLNEALVQETSFSRAISEARKSYKDPQN